MGYALFVIFVLFFILPMFLVILFYYFNKHCFMRFIYSALGVSYYVHQQYVFVPIELFYSYYCFKGRHCPHKIFVNKVFVIQIVTRKSGARRQACMLVIQAF